MTYCITCGEGNDGRDESCRSCGAPLYHQGARPRGRRLSARVSVALMTIVVVLAVLSYSLFVGNGWFARSATVYVQANNDSGVERDLRVYANGHLLFDGPVRPMERVTVEYAPFFLDGDESVTVSYCKDGGGPCNVSWTFTLERGDVRNLVIPL